MNTASRCGRGFRQMVASEPAGSSGKDRWFGMAQTGDLEGAKRHIRVGFESGPP